MQRFCYKKIVWHFWWRSCGWFYNNDNHLLIGRAKTAADEAFSPAGGKKKITGWCLTLFCSGAEKILTWPFRSRPLRSVKSFLSFLLAVQAANFRTLIKLTVARTCLFAVPAHVSLTATLSIKHSSKECFQHSESWRGPLISATPTDHFHSTDFNGRVNCIMHTQARGFQPDHYHKPFTHFWEIWIFPRVLSLLLSNFLETFPTLRHKTASILLSIVLTGSCRNVWSRPFTLDYNWLTVRMRPLRHPLREDEIYSSDRPFIGCRLNPSQMMTLQVTWF